MTVALSYKLFSRPGLAAFALILLAAGWPNYKGVSAGRQPPPPSHTCRIILRGATADRTTGVAGTAGSSFTLEELSIRCWPRAGDSLRAEGSGIAVRFGEDLLRYLASRPDFTPDLEGVQAGWDSVARQTAKITEPPDGSAPLDNGLMDGAPSGMLPGQPPSDSMNQTPSDCLLNDCVVSRDLLESIAEAAGGGLEDAFVQHDSQDWGIDLLDVPHLQLVDSLISGVPLSVSAPLFQCLNCSFLTVQNLTLQALHYHPPTGSARFGYGAARVTGLHGATLDRVWCSDVRGATGWSCILLQLWPDASVDIGSSVFRDNAVEVSRGGTLKGLVPSNTLQCESADETDDGSIYGYGALLLSYLGEQQSCDDDDVPCNAGVASVLLSSTLMVNNTGGCGAGMAVIIDSTVVSVPLQLELVNSTVKGNTAAGDGGGVYFLGIANSTTSISLRNNCTLSLNSAGRRGGGAAVFSQRLEMFSVAGCEVSQNSAVHDGGGLFVSAAWSQPHDSAQAADQIGLHITGSLFLNNTAVKRDGGALHVSHLGDNSTNLSTVLVSNSSFISNRAACNGGGVFLDISSLSDDYFDYQHFNDIVNGILGGVVITAGSVLAHNIAGTPDTMSHAADNNPDCSPSCRSCHAGAIYLGANRIDFPLQVDGSSVTSNYALEDGGAVYIAQKTPQIGLRAYGRSNLSFNTALERGGFMFMSSAWWEGINHTIRLESGTMASYNSAGQGGFLYMFMDLQQDAEVTVDDSYMIGNRASENGGAIYLRNPRSLSVTVGGGSIISLNNVLGDGGAFFLPEVRRTLNFTTTNASIISNNWAGRHGGGVYADIKRGGVTVDGASRILNNTAKSGNGGGFCLQATSTLDYFTVRGQSLLEHNQAGDGNGGAIYLTTSQDGKSMLCSITWENSSLSYNNASFKGGGIYVEANVVYVDVVKGAQWIGNTARDDGGALYVDSSNFLEDASYVNVDGNSQVIENHARKGGAICLRAYSHINVSGGSSLSHNTADLDGGAAFLSQLPAAVYLESCNISSNKASRGSGGALYLATEETVRSTTARSGFCPVCAIGSSPVYIAVLNATFVANAAGKADGGALYVKPHETCCSDTMVIVSTTQSLFDGNLAMNTGGALALYDASNAKSVVVVVNSTFTRNTARGMGGGALSVWHESWAGPPHCQISMKNTVFEDNDCDGGSGGAVALTSCSSQFHRCNFTRNGAFKNGGALSLTSRPTALGLSSSANDTSTRRRSLTRRTTSRNSSSHFIRAAVPWPYRSITTGRRALASTHVAGASCEMKDDGVWTSDISECMFTSNYADFEVGGAMYLAASSDAARICVAHSTFWHNAALQQHAGAVFLDAAGSGAQVHFMNSTFSSNSAERASGGALYLLLGADAFGQIKDVEMSSNQAAAFGGAAVMDVRSSGALYVERLTAKKNSAVSGDGGALLVQVQANGRSALVGCSFDTNKAAGRGGAVLLDGNCTSSLSVLDTSFTSNRAELTGGALYLSYALKRSSLNASTTGCLHTSGDGRAVLRGLRLQGNAAGQQGGAVFLAPASSAAFVNLTMRDNSAACEGGGSLAAQDCLALEVLDSSISSSRSMGIGGGVRASGCRRVMLENVNITGNQAYVSGGGVAISGEHSDVWMYTPDDVDSTAAGNAAAGIVGNYTSMVLHKVHLSDNFIVNSDEQRQSCKQDIRALVSNGMGGGLSISGNVVGVVSQCNLAQPNGALIGTMLASTQRCYGRTASFRNDSFAHVKISDDPADEIGKWEAVWETLDEFATWNCWTLQLLDTLLPPMPAMRVQGGQQGPSSDQGPTLWIDDFLATALQVECRSTASDSSSQTSEDIIAHIRDRLHASLSDQAARNVQYSGLLPSDELAGYQTGVVADAPVAMASGQIKNISQHWFRELTAQIAACITSGESSAAVTQQHPYIGLPPSNIRLQLDQEEEHEVLSLQAGMAFNLHAQLYAMFEQIVTYDVSPSTMQLKLVPEINGSSASNISDLESFVNLDAGLHKNISVPLFRGSATWTGVRAYAWPGLYNLQLTLKSNSRLFVQVASLNRRVQVLPCAVGETLDMSLSSRYNMSFWTSCKSCPSGQYGLWRDSRPYLADLILGSSEIAASSNMTTMMMTLINDKLSEIVSNTDYECKLCPTNAVCPGGAILVPTKGHWHSAANSTLIHKCPNPKACAMGDEAGQQQVEFPDSYEVLVSQLDYRTKILAWCQYLWYISHTPGAAVQAEYDYNYSLGSSSSSSSSSSSTADSQALNRDYLQPLRMLLNTSSTNTTLKCLSFGLPSRDPNSYLQKQCQDGYTGNLCAACMPGFYINMGFNCNPCPGLPHTISLGLISFFSSVLLVLFTAVTNLSESFGEEAGQQPQKQTSGAATSANRLQYGDVIKVIVIHIQYLIIVMGLGIDYPNIILRCQAAISTVTGAENYIVYSPSCLQPDQDSAGQARIQWLAGILTPCAIVAMSMLFWTFRYASRSQGTSCLNGRRLAAGWCAPCFPRAAPAVIHRLDLDGESATQAACDENDESAALGDKNLGAKPPDAADISPAAPPGPLNNGGPSGSPSPPAPTANAALQNSCMDIDDAAALNSPFGYLQPTPTLPIANSLVVDLLGGLNGQASIDDPRKLTRHMTSSALLSTGPVQHRDLEQTGSLPMADSAYSTYSIMKPRESSNLKAPKPHLLDNRDSWETQADDDCCNNGGKESLETCSSSSRPQPYKPHSSSLGLKLRPLSHIGSLAINESRRVLHKLRSQAVQSSQSLRKMFSQVDDSLSLQEQLGVVLMAAVFILYPSWAHAALSTFACYHIDSGEGPFPDGQQATWKYGYWVRNMQMQCYSGVHLGFYMPLGVVAVVVFCLLPPLTSFLAVWRLRGRLDDEHVRQVYGFLYKRYKPRFIWWETVIQLETLILVAVEVLGRGLNTLSHALLLSAVFTVIALINVSCAPLRSRLLVILEFMSLAALSLTITTSLYFINPDGLSPPLKVALAILIVMLNAGLILVILCVASRHLWFSAAKQIELKTLPVLRRLPGGIYGKIMGRRKFTDGDDMSPSPGCWRATFGRPAAATVRRPTDGGTELVSVASHCTTATLDDDGLEYPLELLSSMFHNNNRALRGAPDLEAVVPRGPTAGAMGKGIDALEAKNSVDAKRNSSSAILAARLPSSALSTVHIMLDQTPKQR